MTVFPNDWFWFWIKANLERPLCSEIVESNAAALFPSLDVAATDVSVGGKHDDIAKIP